MAIPYAGADWYIVLQSPILNRTVVDDTLDSVSVTYTATHKDQPYLTGSLIWGANGRTNAWSAKIALPDSPGILKVVVLVTAIINGDPVDGKARASLEVVTA